MKNIRLTFATLGILLGASIPALAAVESAAAAQPCVVHKASGFTVNDDKTITASFQVVGGAGCTQPVTVETWNTNNKLEWTPQFFTTQTWNDSSTQTFGVGQHNLTAKLPVCSTDPNVISDYQADIVASANPPHTITNPGFYWTHQVDGTSVIPQGIIGGSTCPPAPAQVNICNGDTVNVNTGTAAQGGDCSTNTTVVNNTTPPATPTPTPGSTPVASAAAQPTALVNTGPGNIAALFAAVTAGGYILHSFVSRKFLRG